jgi:hypothetical protein
MHSIAVFDRTISARMHNNIGLQILHFHIFINLDHFIVKLFSLHITNL